LETQDDAQRVVGPVVLARSWPRAAVLARPAGEDPFPWPNASGRRPVVVLVTIVDTNVDRMFTRTFAGSPIRIGSHRSTDLRLRHPEIARCHGEIGFEPGSLWFRNRAWTKRTFVDEASLTRGEAVTLTDQSVISIGPFRIDVSLCKLRFREAERSRRTTPLVLPAYRELFHETRAVSDE
jgi:hypothetical protein